MRFLYSPQFNEKEKINYQFENDVVIIESGDKIETFDFSGLPNGRAEAIESDVFEFCPILSAERKEDILHLELLNYIRFDAPEDECFPKWQEVVLDG